jgi:hypothetical protein
MSLKRSSFFLFSVFAIMIGRGLAQNYGPQVSYRAGTFPIGIAKGDFNHDGNLDVVVANFNSNSLSVFLGNGDGTFLPASTIPVGGLPISIAVADFDGNGNLDLAVALENSQAFQLLLGRGDGTFGAPVTIPVSTSVNGVIAKIVAADFNDDGKPDLAVAGTGGVQLFLNNGGGGFSPGLLLIGIAGDVIVADLNGDGHQDLVYMLIQSAACGAEGVPFLQLGNGDGTFQSTVQLPVTLSDPSGMVVADVNKDGRPDLVLSDAGIGSCPSGSVTNGSVQVLLQQPDGSFSLSATISSTIHPGAVAVGDFDGDGKQDIAVLQSANASVTPVPADAVMIYLGDGNGQFSGPHQFKVGGSPEGVVAAPFTNTGALDIAVSDAGSDSMSVLVNQGANTVTMSSSANPSQVFGQVTLTATVQPKFSGSGTLSGSITFIDGSTTLGTASVDSSGTASLTFTFITAGDHTLGAVFSGNTSFVGGSSANLDQVVNRAVPAVAMTSLLNPSLFGQTVSFHVAVSAVPSGTVPSGGVSLNSGDLTIGAAVLDTMGSAVITVTSLPVGPFAITALYSGDTKYAEAFSAPLVQTVDKSPDVSTLAVSPNSSIFGQVVTFTAAVTAAAGGSGTPGGVISFGDGGKPIGAANLDGTGKASLAVSSLSAGNHSITANYGGDGNFLASASPAVAVTVNKSATTTTLLSTPNPSVFGQGIVLSVAVAASGEGAGIPSGVVTIQDGTTTLGTLTVDGSGKATLAASSLAVGNHSISASYAGDANFNPSAATNAAGVTQVVNQSSTVTSISSSANPVVFGQAISLTAAVVASGGGSGTPAGSVTFRVGALSLGTTTLDDNGKATIPLSSLAVGTHNITASYSGSVNYLSSVTSVLTETINRDTVLTTVTSAPNPSVFGQTVTFTLQVVAAPPGGSPGTPTPSGSVTLTDGGGTLVNSVLLDSAGKAVVTATGLSVGSHSFVATYSGDQNFLPGPPAPYMQTVTRAPTLTVLTSSANPTTNASSIKLTAAVISAPGTASGRVTFLDGGNPLQSIPLDKTGSAMLPLSNLPVGSHNFTAAYSGDSSFAISQSSALNESVVDSHSAVVLNSSASPQIVTEPVTFAVTVTPALGGAASDGTVAFSDGQTILATVPVKNSAASFTTAALLVGDHRIAATYQAASAPGPFDGVSPVFQQTIDPAPPIIIIGGHSQDFTIAVSQPNGQLSAGQTFTTDVVLTPVNGLTGQVATLCAGTPEGSTCSVNTDAAAFDGKTPISAKLVVTTTGSSAKAILGTPWSPRGFPWAAMGLSVALGLAVLPFASKRSRRFAMVTAMAGALAGCGGTTFKTQTLAANTPPGTYTITVQSQSGSLVHSAPVVLMVK